MCSSRREGESPFYTPDHWKEAESSGDREEFHGEEGETERRRGRTVWGLSATSEEEGAGTNEEDEHV